jgi:DNA mismatch repair protein MutS
LRTALKEVADLERLVGRLNLGSATPRDLNALRCSLERIPAIRGLLANAESALLQVLHESLDELADLRTLIESSIEDDPPAKVIDGGVIKSGYSPELDELRSISRNAKQTIAALEATRTLAAPSGRCAFATTTSSVTSLRFRRRMLRVCPGTMNDGKLWRTLNDTPRLP